MPIRLSSPLTAFYQRPALPVLAGSVLASVPPIVVIVVRGITPELMIFWALVVIVGASLAWMGYRRAAAMADVWLEPGAVRVEYRDRTEIIRLAQITGTASPSWGAPAWQEEIRWRQHPGAMEEVIRFLPRDFWWWYFWRKPKIRELLQAHIASRREAGQHLAPPV